MITYNGLWGVPDAGECYLVGLGAKSHYNQFIERDTEGEKSDIYPLSSGSWGQEMN